MREACETGDEPLDAGLRAAFGPDPATGGERGPSGGGSVLAVLGRACGAGPYLSLRGEPDGPPLAAGVVGGEHPPELGRYRVAGEIARGGVGVVWKGRDIDLGREVAIKTLRVEYAGAPAMVRRLVEEARIGGQLQHPGILPVYEIGLDAARGPYFTMKLVRGATLAETLAGRPGPSADRGRFLAVFEQVCQTVAYAHARGVVHRDLKPANVMVGSYGEVQVVDWGLARVLTGEDPADGAGSGQAVAGFRAGSETGSVIGTPAYMPPEQARGEVDGLDERCDVFALGAILCEILTGLPPYSGARDGVLRQAAAGETGPALARLAAVDADASLVRIARSCLAVQPGERPGDAGAVAWQIAAYRASAEGRAREAETEAAEARGRAAAERRARRLTSVAAAVTVLAALAVSASALRAERERTRAERAHALAVQAQAEVERHRALAERRRAAVLQNTLALVTRFDQKTRWLVTRAGSARGRDAAEWAEALALTAGAVRQALAVETDPQARRRAGALLEELRAAEEAARSRISEVPTP